MVQIKEVINKSLTIKDAYMDGMVLVDEDGTPVDLYQLLQDTYKDGTQFTIKVITKANRIINE